MGMKFGSLVSIFTLAGIVAAFATNPMCAETTPSLSACYLVVTDHIKIEPGKDVSSEIQKLIEDNPNRTIFFPDGVYLLSNPIYTPSDPTKSVSLKLANYAVLKAMGDWKDGEAVVQLGGINQADDIYTIGSNYIYEGGAIDGSGVANGISINSGRETLINNVSIKNTVVGLHLKKGPYRLSSDADIKQVNIVGTGKTNSIGVLVEGYDNTFSNMRIAKVFTGVLIRSGGNIFRDIHPLYTCDYEDYQNSTGFLIEHGENRYDYCYSDQFGVGFRTMWDGVGFFHNCFVYWYSPKGGVQTAFKADKKFNSTVTNFRADFRRESSVTNIVLSVGEPGGYGTFDNLSVDEGRTMDRTYKDYQDGKARNR